MIKLKELLFGKPDCGCGCGNCEGTQLKEQTKITENLQYHLDNKIPLNESIFRISSNAHVKLFSEVRKLWELDKIQLSESDEYFMYTDAGRQGVYKGKIVPLDLPYIMEERTAIDDAEMLVSAIMSNYRFDMDTADDIIDNLSNNDFKIAVQMFDKGNEKEALKYILSKTTLDEATKKKKKNPPLNKPKRGGPKAYYVYIRDPKTKKIKKVTFGSGGLKAKIGNKEASQAFAKRHRCDQKKDRTKASYWSCNLPRYAKQLGLADPASRYW